MSSHPYEKEMREKEKELEAEMEKMFGQKDESLKKDFFLRLVSKLAAESYLDTMDQKTGSWEIEE